jgi:hypothetical protein
MKLWRKSMPSRFHSFVVINLKQKKTVQEIYQQLINQGKVDPKRHHKSEEEVLAYIRKIKDSFEA